MGMIKANESWYNEISLNSPVTHRRHTVVTHRRHTTSISMVWAQTYASYDQLNPSGMKSVTWAIFDT